MKNLQMRKVAKQIIEKPIKKEIITKLQNHFFQIMRDNNIKEGEWIENGRQMANPEWTMCKVLFFDKLVNNLTMSFLYLDVPKDLLAYKNKLHENES